MDNTANPNTPAPGSEWIETPPNAPPPTAVNSATEQPTPSGGPSNPQSSVSNTIVSFPQGRKIGGFRLFVIISVLILLGVWGIVGYLYYQNNSMKAETVKITPAVTQAPTPTPELNPNEIQISNGDVVHIMPSGESSVLVKKEDYPQTGITGFAKVIVSPNKKDICFESIAPAIEPALYLAKIDGSDVIKVEKNRNTCTWLPDSRRVLYLNAPIGTKAVDIYSYDLDTKTESNLTKDTQTTVKLRQYALSQSGSTISCQFIVVNTNGKKISDGACQIDSRSATISDLIESPTPPLTNEP